MMARKKLWQIPPEYRLEIITLALASEHNLLAERISHAARYMDISDFLDSENTFSQSMQKQLDKLFGKSIEAFSKAKNSWELRLLWNKNDCARQPARHLWALCTHPCVSELQIDHACMCTRCGALPSGKRFLTGTRPPRQGAGGFPYKAKGRAQVKPGNIPGV